MSANVTRLIKVIEGNGQPGLLRQFQDLTTRFDVYESMTKNNPDIAQVRQEIKDVSEQVEDMQNELMEGKKKEGVEDERRFIINTNNKNFKRGFFASLTLFVMGNIFTIVWSIYSVIHHIK